MQVPVRVGPLVLDLEEVGLGLDLAQDGRLHRWASSHRNTWKQNIHCKSQGILELSLGWYSMKCICYR